MPITNHTELVAAMGARMNRIDLAGPAADAVVLYEAEANRQFRTPEMLMTTILLANARVVSLPVDYLQMKRLTSLYQGQRRNLEPMGTESTTRYDPGVSTGQPRWYDIVDQQIELMPAPGGSASLELVYYQRIPPLATAPNWLIAVAPDVYLYGALKHLAVLRGDDQRLANYMGLYNEAAAALSRVSKRSQYGSALQIKVA